jgi:hypothetical protein
MEFNEYYKLSEINKEQFNFLNYCYSIIVHKSRTYNEIEKNINLLKNDKIIYILKFGFGIGNGIESFDIYNFHLRWLFCNNSIISDNNELNQFEKDYNLGYKYFEDNFKKVAPDVNHIEMLIDNFNNEWKQKLTTVYVADKGLIKNSYYDNGFLNAYIEYEKNHKYLFEKISNTIEPQQNETIKNDEIENKHPKFSPNNWNKDCFELFKYLFDEYYKGTKRQITNIWFYLKECGNNKYTLKATKEQYQSFIFENYQIQIKNFDKAQTKWEDKECGTINDHRINFEANLKQIAEHAKNT